MKNYHVSQLPGFLRRAGVGLSRILWKSEFVRNFHRDGDVIRALVFDPSLVLPSAVEVRLSNQDFFCSCDCGSEKPCPHAGALWFEIHERGLYPSKWDSSFIFHAREWEDDELFEQGLSKPGESRNDAQEILQLDLFSGTEVRSKSGKSQKRKIPTPRENHRAGNQPESFSLDFTQQLVQTPKGEEKTEIPSGTLSSRIIRGQVIFRLVPYEEGFRVIPGVMTGDSEELGFFPYEEGVLYRTLPEPVEEVLTLIQGNETQNRGTDLHEILEHFEEWDTSEVDHYRRFQLPVHQEGNTIPVKIVKINSLGIRFVRQDNQDGGLLGYLPLFTWHFDYGARPLTTRGQLPYWVREGQLYWYQEDRNWICFHDTWFREIRFLGFLREMGKKRDGESLVFSQEHILTLQSKIAAEGISSITLDFSEDEENIYSPMPKGIVLIQGNQRGTELSIYFRYKSWEPAYQQRDSQKEIPGPQGTPIIIRRNMDAEASLVHDLVQILGTEILFERGYYATEVRGTREADLQVSTPINDFLLTWAGQLISRGYEIRIENKKIRIARDVKFSVQQNMDWFGVQAEVQVADENENERRIITDSREQYDGDGIPTFQDRGEQQVGSLGFDENFQRYGLGLGSGEYVLLKEKDIRRLEYLRRQGMTDDGVLQSSPANLVLIDAIYEKLRNEDSGDTFDWDSRRRAFHVLQDLNSLPQVALPGDLQAKLRNYQKTGLDWLVFMHENQLNGCLADDMGLGKTLQTISLLTYLKERRVKGPSLLITPVVTLGNWEQEFERFSPGLKILRHSGNNRIEDSRDFDGADIVLVSYHTLRIDIEVFLDGDFSYIILDEAHYIKNHYSQVFKAVRSLRSRHRLSLTGTPIENTLMELWSQMNFLNPGLLGTAKSFYDRYFVPIERQGNEQVLEELKDIVAPFILRRTKEEVLDDLPAKEVIVQYCEMDDKQAEVYKGIRDGYRDRILGILDSRASSANQSGKKGASIEIFQFLLKLRQLAIHPPLAGPDFEMVSSAKMDGLLMLLEDILTENHKVLIFSQFLGTLDIIGKECERKGWKYSLLTGATPDRSKEISTFQNDLDTKVFLLSLKAGGVGINLTAADYVILFDPWWNPAAEKQAIDRAHRMGQKRKVIAYKLIVRGTIEEKILQLQDRKHALAQEIVSQGGKFLSGLDKNEVVNLFT